ncbi:hypothetical protein KUL25_20785 [Rhodobacteraceae bacterium N5(2021)]|uniref:Uncharacterized protein n=1 Tax=Gymnodinialimonas phycosphaerae TaxID=2841589 RepID=A0A975TUL8_9RHOB|nr:hypothetical protein [Gymnodinialimonas phycosphaerae]MBY4895206.1 hypothetical protein [Gymnodinialimonas phycosphaerae]
MVGYIRTPLNNGRCYRCDHENGPTYGEIRCANCNAVVYTDPIERRLFSKTFLNRLDLKVLVVSVVIGLVLYSFA